MKRVRCIIAIITIFLIMTIIIIKVYMKESTGDLREEFNRWENTEIHNDKKEAIIKKLLNYLRHSDVHKEQIESLSPYLKIFNYEKFLIIRYVENPKIYGNSAKYSYYFLHLEEDTELITTQDSINITDVLEVDEDEYLLIAEDYKFSNRYGVRLLRVKIINSKPVIELDIIEKETLPEGVSIVGNSVYSDEPSLQYRIQGKRIFLDNEINKYELILQSSNKYSVKYYTE